MLKFILVGDVLLIKKNQEYYMTQKNEQGKQYLTMHYFKALCALMGRGHPIESLTGIPKGT